MAKRPKTDVAAVVWDLDGTLVDSAADIAASLNRLLAETGLETLDETRVRDMIGEGVAVLIRRGFGARGVTPDRKRLEHLVGRFLAIYSEAATASTHLFPDAREVLEALGDAGLRQAICTNKPEAITRQVLSGFGIAEHFSVVVGGDTLPRNKPDPLPLRTALAGLGVTPEQALMVGDSSIDVLMAHAAGVHVAFVTFGYGPEPPDAQRPDYRIDQLVELPGIVAGLGATQLAGAGR
ncbi:MAG TPA: phosphoglycolate phosphatase [Woeseiaceae bacterium]|nr:phosphoglycolate phosphatase [Woeseiaceae bacterium]